MYTNRIVNNDSPILQWCLRLQGKVSGDEIKPDMLLRDNLIRGILLLEGVEVWHMFSR